MADFNMTEANRGELMLLQLQMPEVMTQNAVLMAKILNKQRKRRQANRRQKRREEKQKRREERREEVCGYESGCKEDQSWANILNS